MQISLGETESLAWIVRARMEMVRYNKNGLDFVREHENDMEMIVR